MNRWFRRLVYAMAPGENRIWKRHSALLKQASRQSTL